MVHVEGAWELHRGVFTAVGGGCSDLSGGRGFSDRSHHDLAGPVVTTQERRLHISTTAHLMTPNTKIREPIDDEEQ
ncbi:hypothetical protein Pcinc_001858 [Petrolisthes cinctipes]|uniref:Uncharacterized protein n=1 Tax=Petrolisthes cinctipes TaxID=88211 RepID=A0AAE1L3J8_PETCI|nr:hypothetical protein Pcinc_001858 [Petrolisthes cinctipes]